MRRRRRSASGRRIVPVVRRASPVTISRSSSPTRAPSPGRLARAWLAIAALVGLGFAPDLDEKNDEHAVKAAFLYNFTKYVKWPESAFASPKDPLVVAVVGQDPFGKKLDEALKGKTVGMHPLSVVRWKSGAEIERCHLLFVSDSDASRLPRIVEACREKPVLLVGEARGFASRGGAIGFYIQDKKVRFEINPESARRAQLEVSSQLLKLARIVKDDGEER